MSQTLKQVRATVSPEGEVVLEEPLDLERTMIATVTVVLEDDDGLAEVKRRSEELDRDPSMGMTMEEFKKSFGR